MKSERLDLEKLRSKLRDVLAANRSILEHFLCPLILEQLEPRLEKRFSAVRVLTHLTWREQEVLLLLSLHFQAKDIADILGVSNSSVKTHVQRLMRKLGAASSPELGELLSRLQHEPKLVQWGSLGAQPIDQGQ